MRAAIYQVHSWIALSTGAILIVASLTGGALVFELQMDRWVDPSISYVKGGTASVPFSEMLATVQNAFPGKKMTELDAFGPGTTILFKLDGGVRAYVNPFTGALVGSRDGETLSFWIRHVHRELAAGPVGRQVINAATLLLLIQGLTGLYLWWPRQLLRIRWNAAPLRRNLDLHHVIGFGSALFVCLIAITGLVKTYGDDLQPFFDRITNSPVFKRDQPSKAASVNTRPISIDLAVEAARTALPGAMLARIQPPKGPAGS